MTTKPPLTVVELRDLFLKVLEDNKDRDITSNVVRCAAGIILSGAHTSMLAGVANGPEQDHSEAFTVCLTSVDNIMKGLARDIQNFKLKGISMELVSQDGTRGDAGNLQ